MPGGRFLERPAVLEIRSYSGGPKTVVADFGFDLGRLAPTIDHGPGVGLGQGGAGELAGAAADRAEQRSLGIPLRPAPAR